MVSILHETAGGETASPTHGACLWRGGRKEVTKLLEMIRCGNTVAFLFSLSFKIFCSPAVIFFVTSTCITHMYISIHRYGIRKGIFYSSTGV
jgi:hypothetical protein